jgi:hypothetical protein
MWRWRQGSKTPMRVATSPTSPTSPGDPGHDWVRERFAIDNLPLGAE